MLHLLRNPFLHSGSAPVAVLLGLLLVSTRSAASPVPGDQNPPSILLFTLDTTRADALGCYGAKGNPTPVLDRLARRGVRFVNTLAPCPITLPSHATILTGLYPPEHGLRDNSPRALSPSIPVVTTALQKRGYNTAAFVSAEPVAEKWGLRRGFGLYNEGTARSPSRLSPPERRGGDTVRAAGLWLKAMLPSSSPFFLWVHLFDPHHPYRAPEPHASRFPGSPYAAEVAYTDECVGRLLKILEDAGRLDATVVIATADHGEGLGDHNEQTHAHLVHGSTLRVPLILAWPEGWKGGRTIQEPVGLVDLAPTLYHLLDAKPPRVSGLSLLRVLNGEASLPARRPLYGESLYDFLHFGWAPLRCIRVGNELLIEADKAVRLYDLSRDPDELSDLSLKGPKRVRPLRIALARLVGAFGAPPPGASGVLNAPPGYLQAPHAGPTLKKDAHLVGKRRNPMEAVGDISAFEKAKQLSFSKTPASLHKALDLLDILLKRDSDNPSYRFWCGRAHRNLCKLLKKKPDARPEVLVDHLERAKKNFVKVLNRRPQHKGAQNLLFLCFLLLNDPEPVVMGAEEIIQNGYENNETRFFLAQAFLPPSPIADLDRADHENREGLQLFPHGEMLRKQRKEIDRLLLKRKVENRKKKP